MRTHPECHKNEVFIGNTDEPIPPHLAGIRTLRLGTVAYDLDGKRLPKHYRPMLVDRGDDYEKYNSVMEARLSRIRQGISLD
jgi:hypothetical protein